MEIQYFMPLWGNDHLPLSEFFKKIKDAGYDGVEMNIPFDKSFADELQNLLAVNNLLLIAQQWLAPKKETVDEYIARMVEYLRHLVSFQPYFINSHTGKDFFSFDNNCRIIEEAELVSKETGVSIYHETHRGRCLYSAPMSKLYFEQLPELKITADFSHWCCVSESLLEGQENVVDEAIQRTRFIHARVGNSQSPQVNHPFAPENKKDLENHLEWWQKIIDNQKLLGAKTFPITTEFGPSPYLQTLPFTKQVVADLWNINLGMMHFLKRQIKT